MTTTTPTCPDPVAPERTTEAASPPPHSRIVGVVSLLAFVMVMVRVTTHASAPLNNGDTWFHLRIGHEFWGDWSIVDPGALSSFATASWVPTQWSTQMAAAAMESRFGLPGVAWLFGALFLLFVVAVYFLGRSEGAALPTTLATGVVFIAAGSSLSARPQVVSLILFTGVVWMWLRAARLGRPPWLLIPLTWFWATAHGLWTTGVLLGLVMCVGLLLERRIAGRKAALFFAVPALSLLAACLTPVGPRLVAAQFAVGERTSLIGEWGPTSFREVPAIVTALFVGTLIVLWSRRSRVDWTPVLMLLLGSAWILTVDRMVAFGAILIAPLFVQAFTELTGDRRESLRLERLVVGATAVTCLLGLALAVPHTAKTPADVPTRFTPVLAKLPAGSPVLVEDHSGAWMEWRFTHLNPVIDGMFDAYTVDHMEEFAAFRRVEPGWAGFVQRSGASYAVLVQGSPITAAMQSQLRWSVVQRDENWVLLTAPS
jgi:uncharacterized membrane protein